MDNQEMPPGLALLPLMIGSAICLCGQSIAAAPDLRNFSTKTLVSCFKQMKPCYSDQWSIADELAKRANTESLLDLYWSTRHLAVRAGIEKVAYRQESETALAFMERVVAAGLDDGDDLYYPINYLAKRCLKPGLQALATGKFRKQGSLQYATSVKLFGQCGYRPAIPYLVDEAVWDASLNIVIAAEESLKHLYPHSPAQFGDLTVMQRYFCAEAVKEGFPVRCRSRIGTTSSGR